MLQHEICSLLCSSKTALQTKLRKEVHNMLRPEQNVHPMPIVQERVRKTSDACQIIQTHIFCLVKKKKNH